MDTKDEANGLVGYVTCFDVEAEYVSRYQPYTAGAEDLLELWVPAEELEDFNDHIIGKINVTAEYRAHRADSTR